MLADKAVAGFTVNAEHIADLVEKNPIMVTALNPIIGYDLGAKIAKRAYAENRRVKDVAAEMTDLSAGRARPIARSGRSGRWRHQGRRKRRWLTPVYEGNRDVSG